MPVIVQKFGGTSVADTTRILRCARRALEAKQSGNDVIVVVSAMGHTTDELIDLAKQITDAPNPREMDMLMATGEQVSIALMAIALNSLGNNAVSMTGPQMGMLTNEIHTKARIQSINVDRIRKELSAGRIVVAAGFQGVTDDGQITTLGRGGSDTTAVAIAAALLTLGGGAGSVTCEIYTDVDGVYTADPRIVPNARKLARISYEEMLELANQGAAVMHNRAVLFGQKYDVPIHVRSSTKADLGTIICKETSEMEDIVVAGCALKRDLGRISLRRIPNNPGVQGMVFDCIAKANIIVDDIIQTQHGDLASLSFTVDHNDLADVKIAAGKALDEIGTGELAVEIGLAKVSVAGVGMRTHSGVAAAMFRALGDAGINIANITTSDIKISCIVPKQDGERALKVVHDAFQLDKPQGNWANSPKAVETKPDTRKAVRST
ncbi:MAG: aspartate kinase [Phycisphaerales bacterium]|nr:aspartate kinase [Phycisphaerales bacterium]MCI0631354.1 aspartate kinase [Phycisphaerales bacterium]